MSDFPDIKEGKLHLLKNPNLIFERKWDGAASKVIVDSPIALMGRNTLKSGEQMNFTHRFPEVVRALEALRIPQDTEFFGELVVVNPKTGFEEFQLIQPRITRDEEIESFSRSNPAILIIYDCSRVAGRDVSLLPYVERMKLLKEVVKQNESIRFIVDEYNGQVLWDFTDKNNLEGIIIRDPNAPFGEGIWRLKHTTTQDVYCKGEWEKPEPSVKKGQNEPTPSRLQLMEYTISNEIGDLTERRIGVFANIKCYQIVDNQEMHIGNIGGGFRDADRKRIQVMLDNRQPFCIEVKAKGFTKDGKLREPRFVRMREDKSPIQCVRKT